MLISLAPVNLLHISTKVTLSIDNEENEEREEKCKSGFDEIKGSVSM